MKKVIAISTIIIFLSSCKKDVPVYHPIQNVSNSQQSNFPLSNDTTFYAYFQVLENQDNLGHNDFQAFANFYSAPSKGGHDTLLQILVDSVKFDNASMLADTAFSNPNDQYALPYPYSIYNNYNNVWNIKGSNGVPSFMFNQNPLPAFDFSLIPDTIDHTQPLTLPIHISFSNNATVSLNSGTYKYINPITNTSVSYTPSELSFSTNFIYFYVWAYNINTYNVFGKPMNFRYTYEFTKKIYIK